MRLALSNVNEFFISPGILEKTLVSLREYGLVDWSVWFCGSEMWRSHVLW